jgi:lipoprotein-anchoring transpeptidase ErfK/SrfK
MLAALAVAVVAILIIWVIWPSGSTDTPNDEAGGPMLVTGVGSVPGDDGDDATTTPTDPAPTAAPAATEAAPATPPTAERSRPIVARDTPAAVDEPASRTPSRTPGPARSANRARAQVERGRDLLARSRPIEGRQVLSDALRTGALDPADAKAVREELTKLNEVILFSPQLVPDDPYAFVYAIKPNQALSLIPRKLGLQADWRLIQHVNRISYPERVQAGQRLKVLTGPFHAVVHKSDYRMDVFLGDEEAPVYVRSFPVGLGEFNSTPEIRFRVKKNSKLINPAWQNPRTGERFDANDPENPIGERWLGLLPEEERLRGMHVGFGIHGTIEPESIGTQSSMGCIRLGAEDVKLVWAMLMEDVSSVEVVP